MVARPPPSTSSSSISEGFPTFPIPKQAVGAALAVALQFCRPTRSRGGYLRDLAELTGGESTKAENLFSARRLQRIAEECAASTVRYSRMRESQLRATK